MLPEQRDIAFPLLQVLAEMGGKGGPRDIYLPATGKFAGMRDERALIPRPTKDHRAIAQHPVA